MPCAAARSVGGGGGRVGGSTFGGGAGAGVGSSGGGDFGCAGGVCGCGRKLRPSPRLDRHASAAAASAAASSAGVAAAAAACATSAAAASGTSSTTGHVLDLSSNSLKFPKRPIFEVRGSGVELYASTIQVCVSKVKI